MCVCESGTALGLAVPGCPPSPAPCLGTLCPATALAPGYRRVPAVTHVTTHRTALSPVCSLGLGDPTFPGALLVSVTPWQQELWPRLRTFSCRVQAALKKYQTEQRSKGDSLDKCQAELKKLRKKSQGSKNPQKYSDKELQVGPRAGDTSSGWGDTGGCSVLPVGLWQTPG